MERDQLNSERTNIQKTVVGIQQEQLNQVQDHGIEEEEPEEKSQSW